MPKKWSDFDLSTFMSLPSVVYGEFWYVQDPKMTINRYLFTFHNFWCVWVERRRPTVACVPLCKYLGFKITLTLNKVTQSK